MKGQAYTSTNSLFSIDVHDIALPHLFAMEKEEAGGNRFFITGCPLLKARVIWPGPLEWAHVIPPPSLQ